MAKQPNPPGKKLKPAEGLVGCANQAAGAGTAEKQMRVEKEKIRKKKAGAKLSGKQKGT